MTKVQVNGQGKVYVANGKALLSTGTPVITSLNVTPTTSAQTITAPSGTDGYSPVNVSAVTSSIDVNITAENIKKDVTILGVTGTYEGSGGASGKYQLLERISDDNNNEIGTVSGFFTDSNSVEYAVVCLDAQYRLGSKQWTSSGGAITNMPISNTWAFWEASETATENTTLILASKTSSACTHCRSQSFVIDGITYYGQLPNIYELVDIAKHRTAINEADTSGAALTNNTTTWSSTQFNITYAWTVDNGGGVSPGTKTNNYFVCPVLEIPNS